jgi:hypothetical protein
MVMDGRRVHGRPAPRCPQKVVVRAQLGHHHLPLLGAATPVFVGQLLVQPLVLGSGQIGSRTQLTASGQVLLGEQLHARPPPPLPLLESGFRALPRWRPSGPPATSGGTIRPRGPSLYNPELHLGACAATSVARFGHRFLPFRFRPRRLLLCISVFAALGHKGQVFCGSRPGAIMMARHLSLSYSPEVLPP